MENSKFLHYPQVLSNSRFLTARCPTLSWATEKIDRLCQGQETTEAVSVAS